ncbi:MAG: hypothetical protein PW788_11455 [Micavibrio sp.]|nr:hypothetical protein [Micavibrio sp.]
MSVSGIVRALQSPLLYTNLLIAAGTGVYFALTGYVTLVWPFIVGLLFSPIVLPLLLTPVGLFAGMAHILSQQKPGIARILNILSVGTLVTAMTGTVVLTLRLVYAVALVQPLAAVFGAAIAIAAWALLGMKDRQNLFFTGMLLMLQITTIGIAYGMVTQEWDTTMTFWSFWVAMVAMVLLQTAYEAMFIKPVAAAAPAAQAPASAPEAQVTPPPSDAPPAPPAA